MGYHQKMWEEIWDNIKRRTEASEVKIRDEELVDRYIARSGIFFIWSGRRMHMYNDELCFVRVEAEEGGWTTFVEILLATLSNCNGGRKSI